MLVASVAVVCLVGFASKPGDVARFPGLILGSFAGVPEWGGLLFFGSALLGLGIWIGRRSR